MNQLRGMRIKSLSIKDASIMDLSPLVGMRLNHLACYRTKVADLSPLRGMPLEHFLPDVRLFDETDEAVLRSLPVQRINIDIHGQSTPIAEFWQELAQRRDAAKAFVVEASQLSPVERVTAVRGKLNQLNVVQVNYGLSRALREKHESAVTAEAIASYRARGLELAKAFGFSNYALAEVSVNSNEGSDNRPVPMMKAARFSADAAEAALPVEPGKGNITVTVSGQVILTP